MEWLIVASVIVTGLVSSLFLAYVVRKMVRDTVEGIEGRILGFVASPKEGEPSQFALTVSACARIMTDELKSSLSGAMMGQASAIAKQMDGIQGDIIGDGLAASNPLLAALLQFSPSLKKRITKNPAAIMALSGIASSLTGGGNGHKPSGNNGQSSFTLG